MRCFFALEQHVINIATINNSEDLASHQNFSLPFLKLHLLYYLEQTCYFHKSQQQHLLNKVLELYKV